MKASQSTRPLNKAQRARARLFTDSRFPVYEPKPGTYSAVPWVLRRALAAIPPRTFQVLVYFFLRSGPESVSWFSDKQIAADLGIGYRKVAPHVRWLAEHGFVAIGHHAGERFIALLSPEHALRDLAKGGLLDHEVVDRLVEDFDVLGLDPLDLDLTQYASSEQVSDKEKRPQE